jgi:hypothetical protein
LIKHVLSPEGKKIPRKVFHCREDTGIVGPAAARGGGSSSKAGGRKRGGKRGQGQGAMPEPEPEVEPGRSLHQQTGATTTGRPSSAPERKSLPVVLTVPAVAQQPPQQAPPSASADDNDVDGVDDVDEVYSMEVSKTALLSVLI